MMQRQRPLISAKLKAPVPRPNRITRQKLQQRLHRLGEYKVTVVKGAPGSGKSTLLAAYLSEHPSLRARWISLDANDNDVRTLWSYVLEALRPDLEERAASLRELLGATLQAGDVDSVLVELVNILQPYEHLFLILDDAHHITDPRVIESLQFFLRYSSDRVHLVLLSREEPGLHLSEWRMAGQLLEIDNDDLKVSGDEARQFLTKTLGLQLDEALIERLTTLAEGWLGGLQLLGVAVEQRRERVHSIGALNHPVVEYLSEEILHSLPEQQRRFAVETSILTYLHEDVCRAVTDSDSAGSTLRALVAKNLFVIAVDEDEGLYRYHHLFHQFLQQRVQRLSSDDRRILHRRAARFYRQKAQADGRREDAEKSVHHYLQAEEYDEALHVIAGISSSVASWRLLQKLPLTALKGKPDFIYQRLFSHMAEQQFEQCAAVISHFRGTFADDAANTMLDLFSMLIEHRPLQFHSEQLTTQHLRRLPLRNETKAVLYSLLAMVLTIAEREQEALTCLDEANRIVVHVDNPYIRYYCLQFKGQLKEHMGDLAECEAIYEDMFRLAERHSFLAPVVTSAHVGIVGILLKGGRLAEARTYLDKVKARMTGGSAAAARSTEMETAYLYNELEFHLLKGDKGAARDVARRLLQLDVLSSSLYTPPMLRYLLLLDMATDADLARFRFEQIQNPNWQDYVLQAQLLLREDKRDAALQLIDGCLRRARKQQAKLPLVDALLVKVKLLAADGEGDRAVRAARDALREAVHYSYEHRLLAPFLLAGEPIGEMARSLRGDAAAELNPSEAAFVDEIVSRSEAMRAEATRGGFGDSLLSERELEVLRVLADGATNKQIAATLHISVSTVKTHVVNIYSKLNVSNRVEAVEEARRHGFIA